MPEFSVVLVWSTGETCIVPLDRDFDPAARYSVLPAIGEVNLLIVTYPPDSTAIPDGFDPAASALKC